MSRTSQTTTTTGIYRTTWNETTSLHDVIVEEVVTATGRARSTIEDQYDHAHARSLCDLFDTDNTSLSSTGVVKFVVAACTVSVHSDGRLIVEPPDSIHHGTST